MILQRLDTRQTKNPKFTRSVELEAGTTPSTSTQNCDGVRRGHIRPSGQVFFEVSLPGWLIRGTRDLRITGLFALTVQDTRLYWGLFRQGTPNNLTGILTSRKIHPRARGTPRPSVGPSVTHPARRLVPRSSCRMIVG
ncbi:hypothetical protein P691DRAFT_573571 [Macrolepiota fuliginosa MF-IS2]|uniref:Uncharacterized protein n=1 Tax=Macrolepiota fuliginosa MF-IS2 TaxID=1400762 RepID=A0A9P5X0P5_9AGAR|nr:hypothetical protein P691DRAFT_573571 [Macrolepiota fuliginosa MF-IS2]